MKKNTSREEERDFYADHENQKIDGPPRRRSKSTEVVVALEFTSEQVASIRDAADGQGVSVQSWIRRVVERRLADEPDGTT